MRTLSTFTTIVSTTVSATALLLAGSLAQAQPPGITMDMINTTLPLEGAPLAVPGAYAVISEEAFNAPRFVVHRPADLSAFPNQDRLPLMIWGNGGCAIDGSRYGEFLDTIASHGFVTMTTTAIKGEERRQQTPADILAAIAWAEQENTRAGAPLRGKIDTSQVAVMGQSCGGFESISVGTDPRVKTIGVFNSGVQPPNPDGANNSAATTDDLARLHGPVLFINGHEKDFLMGVSRDNFERVNHVPTFYGSRHDAGHTATVYHPGGGEFANVASNWLRYQFKGDAEAGKMFVGANCELCTNPNWETEAKGMTQ